MREIKFRAWSTTQKRMYDRVLAGPGDPCSLVWVEERRDWFNFDNASGVIMQYTGLKDKHGNEVYEGDIVKADWHWDELHTVIWPDDYYHLLEYGLEGDNLEVIGNIYEHPEVLK